MSTLLIPLGIIGRTGVGGGVLPRNYGFYRKMYSRGELGINGVKIIQELGQLRGEFQEFVKRTTMQMKKKTSASPWVSCVVLFAVIWVTTQLY